MRGIARTIIVVLSLVTGAMSSMAADIPVVWTNVSNMTYVAPTLTKDNVGNSWTNAGAFGTHGYDVDFVFEMEATEQNKNRMIGVSKDDPNLNYNSIDYAMYLRSNSRIRVYENGSNKGDKSTYVTGDKLQIKRTGDTIEYQKNGVTFYTSAKKTTNTLYVDSSFHTNAGSITNAKFIVTDNTPPGTPKNFAAIGGPSKVDLSWDPAATNGNADMTYTVDYGPTAAFGTQVTGLTTTSATINALTSGQQYHFRVTAVSAANGGGTPSATITEYALSTQDVIWTAKANVDVTGTTIKKLNKNGWNGAAFGKHGFEGDVRLQFEATETNKNRMMGVSKDNPNNSYNTIDYAIYLRSNKNVRIYENGSNKGDKTKYVTGDIFEIERTGTTVTYKKNGLVFYTSGVAATLPLYADTSLDTKDGTFTNVIMAVPDAPRGPGKVGNVTTEALETAVTLRWDVPVTNGSDITSYTIQWDTDGNGFTQSVTGITDTEHTISGLVNGTTYEFRVLGVNGNGNGTASDEVHETPQAFVGVNWINSSGVTITGNGTTTNNVIKTAGNSWTNGGAESFQSFDNSGSIQFTAVEKNKSRMIGLSFFNTDNNHSTIDYHVYLKSNGQYEIREGGSRKKNQTPYETGDIFTISRAGNIVYFYRTPIATGVKTLVYTSSKIALTNYPLLADFSIHHKDGTVDKAQLLFTPGKPGQVWGVTGKSVDGGVELTWNKPANNGTALTGYLVEYGPVGSFPNSTVVAAGALTHTVTGLTNGTDYNFRISATNDGAASYGAVSESITVEANLNYPVTWIDQVNVKFPDGSNMSSIQKDQNISGWGKTGAASTHGFSGDGLVDFLVPAVNKNYMIGLSRFNRNAHHNTIEFAIYVRSNGKYRVYRNGSNKGEYGPYLAGDRFRVERSGNNIYFRINNGTPFHTIDTSSLNDYRTTDGLFVDMAMNSHSSRVNDVNMLYTKGLPGPVWNLTAKTEEDGVLLEWDKPATNGYPITEYEIQYGEKGVDFDTSVTDSDLAEDEMISGLEVGTEYQFRIVAKNSQGSSAVSNVAYATPNEVADVMWTEVVGVSADGNNNRIYKNVLNNGWGNGGARSQSSFSGDGGFEVQAFETNRSRMVGLNFKQEGESYQEIDYAFQIQSSNNLDIYENGKRKKDNFVKYQYGDIIGVYREGNQILYKVNNQTVYTSAITVDSRQGLFLDASIYSKWGKIQHPRIIGVEVGPPGPVIDLVAREGDTGEAELEWNPAGNNRSAITSYEIQYGPVYSNAFGTSVTTNAECEYSITGLLTGVEYQFRIRATNAEGTAADWSNVANVTLTGQTPLTWTNFVGTTDTGEFLKKTSGNGWNAGATSVDTFTRNGGIEWTILELNRALTVGLSDGTPSNSASNNTIDYAIYTHGNNLEVEIRENGSRKNDPDTGKTWHLQYNVGDQFAIERIGDTIYYKRNGSTFYTSTKKIDPNIALHADASLYHTNSKVYRARMFTKKFISNLVTTKQDNDDTIDLSWTNIPLEQDATFDGVQIRYYSFPKDTAVAADYYPASVNDGTLLSDIGRPAAGTTMTTVHNGLLSEYTYRYSVFGKDNSDPVAYDSPLKGEATIDDIVPPDMISNIALTEYIQKNRLTWSNPDDSDYPNTDFVGVKIYRDTSPIGDFEDGTLIADLTEGEESYEDENLDPETTYYYAIFTYDDDDKYNEEVSEGVNHTNGTPKLPTAHLVVMGSGQTNLSEQEPLIGGESIDLIIVARTAEGDVDVEFDGTRDITVGAQLVNALANAESPLINDGEPDSLSLSFTAGVSESFTLSLADVGDVDVTALTTDGIFDDLTQIETDEPGRVSFVPKGLYVGYREISPLEDSEVPELIAGEQFQLEVFAVLKDFEDPGVFTGEVPASQIAKNYAFDEFSITPFFNEDVLDEENLDFSATTFTTGDGSRAYDFQFNDVGGVGANVAGEDHLGNALEILNEATTVIFRPKGITVEFDGPNETRPFYYVGEPMEVTVEVVDVNDAVLPNYRGTLTFTNVENVTLPDDYAFTEEDAGRHIFELSAEKTGEYSFTATDTTYSEVTANTDSVEVRQATLVMQETVTSALGAATIKMQMVDQFGAEITEDSETSFRVELTESIANNTASSSTTTTEITVSKGAATVTVNNLESETVKVTPTDIKLNGKSLSSHEATSGDIIYGGLKAGKIRRFIWVERRRRNIEED